MGFRVLVLCALCVQVVLSFQKAGIYIDNGVDQTEIERMFSKREKQEMELEILDLLGLPKRPRKVNRPPLKKSAPRFMLDVYQALIERENEEDDIDSKKRSKRETHVNLSGEEQMAIKESDVIMTFESVNHHVPSVRHERGKRLWFNVSDIPVVDDIVGAELRIYQTKNSAQKRPLDRKYTVTAYQLINTDDGERELEYITAVNTTGDATGWLGLNLTGCLATWVLSPDANRGIYLSVHPVDKPGREIRPEEIGLVTIKGEDETQPFMVTFLKATNHVKASVAAKPGKTRVTRSTIPNLLMNNMPPISEESRSCRIHTLYIGFKDLEWQDWIIAPEGYSAFYCAGECNFPLNSHMNATNHAIVQTLVHLMSPTKYPKPCCAPTKLTPISVLYFLDDQNVILKKFKKMVAKSCGCH